MSENGLTSDALKQQHAAVIPKARTFEPQGVSEQAALDYLKTDEGALYDWRVAQSATPDTPTRMITDRAVGQLMSGRELPRMETLHPSQTLVKIVPAGTAPSPYSPFWAKEAELNATVKAGKNLSDHFGLPVVSEAPSYDVYRISPKAPTQVFVNTVAPTSELGGAVTKAGGAQQSLVPNRQVFNEPVHVRSVDNTPALLAQAEHPSLSAGLARGAGALGTAALAYDAATTTARASTLLDQGNRTGAQSQGEHFAARTSGGLAGGFGAGCLPMAPWPARKPGPVPCSPAWWAVPWALGAVKS